MNKKFSTLMAGLLLASAFSANAAIDAEKGQYVEIKVGSKALQISETTNALETAAVVASAIDAVTNADELKDAIAQQWQVASIKYDTNSGTPIYQFINKATGQYLAVNLKTDNNGTSTAAAKINAAGNKDWCLTSDNKLYAYQNDSTYTFDSKMKLIANKGANKFDGAATITIAKNTYTQKLSAAVLNALMGKAGKLYFNNENVTSGETNIIADNVWKAYDLSSSSSEKGMFIARFSKDSVTSSSRNPYLLMVDTAVYAGSNMHKLMVDTLALTHTNAEKLKDNQYAYVSTGYNSEKPAKFAHQQETAIWNGTYTFGNDSIALQVYDMPRKKAQLSNITDGVNLYATTGVASGAITVSDLSAVSPSSTPTNEKVKTAKKAAETFLAKEATANPFWKKLSETRFSAASSSYASIDNASGSITYADLIADAKNEESLGTDDKAWLAYLEDLDLWRTQSADAGNHFWVPGAGHAYNGSTTANTVVTLAQLSNTKVLTVKDGITASNHQGTVMPLIQAVSTKGGDAVIDGNGKVYFMQVAKEPAEGSDLRAATLKGKYLVDFDGTIFNEELVDEVDAANVYAQWGFIEGATGYYQIVNRGTGAIASLPINKTSKSGVYEIAGEEFRLVEVDLSNADIREEKGVKYDYTGYYYGGPADGVSQSFQITPASALLSNVAIQFNKDSVLVLGKAENAPVWYLEGGDKTETWGAEIPGLPQLKRVKGYKIYTADAEGTKYYVYATANTPKVYAITKSDSEHTASEFKFQTQAANAYLFVDGENKATINLNLNVPTIEVSSVTNERNDYFSFAKSEYSDYRTLVAEDGLLGNAKIYMENEPSRYLYENTKNIVANNGNKIAKDSLNFLGIYNTAASVQNAALYVDTAYVDRKDNTRPQYMFALGVTEVAATEGHACTETGKHFDADGKETTADKCVHATPGTEGYKTGRYLVTLQDSVATGFTKHPALYDGNYRLAFVEAKHIKDTLEIANSKFTVDEHVKDSIQIGKDLKKATFALKIVDQSTKSFVMETADKTYVRILNGVPVLTSNIADAAVFNIEATTEEATANEAIEASAVQVIAGKGVVTVQGAAGKVITVANILGQTIANQVAASDNVTIAAPAGVLVVTVDGEATKVVVK